jgi:hypothetical protein
MAFEYWAVACNKCEQRPFIPIKEFSGQHETWNTLEFSITCKVCGETDIHNVDEIKIVEYPARIPDDLIPAFYRNRT